MLNVHSSCSKRESAAPSRSPAPANVLTVSLDAGACALPRLANLMAKLDIEPDWMQVQKSPCGREIEVAIDLGEQSEALERLNLRLQGMVTVRAITATA